MTDFPDDPLDLDSLLADSMVERGIKKQAKEPRGKKSTPKKPATNRPLHWMTSKEQEDFKRQISNSSLRALWKPEAAVAMFSIQLCLVCGSRHTHFEGFFQQQRHQSHRDTERWVPATDHTMLLNLPKHKKVTIHEADSCMACVESLGYTDPSPTLTEPSYAAWTPAKHYQKYSNEHLLANGLSHEGKALPVE